VTFGKLKQIVEDNNIPDDVTLMSDSEWECGATDMDGVYYNEEENTIVFTQEGNEYEDYWEDKNWKLLSGRK
jgi:hypothetical protein